MLIVSVEPARVTQVTHPQALRVISVTRRHSPTKECHSCLSRAQLTSDMEMCSARYGRPSNMVTIWGRFRGHEALPYWQHDLNLRFHERKCATRVQLRPFVSQGQFARNSLEMPIVE